MVWDESSRIFAMIQPLRPEKQDTEWFRIMAMAES